MSRFYQTCGPKHLFQIQLYEDFKIISITLILKIIQYKKIFKKSITGIFSSSV